MVGLKERCGVKNSAKDKIGLYKAASEETEDDNDSIEGIIGSQQELFTEYVEAYDNVTVLNTHIATDNKKMKTFIDLGEE